jgi:hypothetical protein
VSLRPMLVDTAIPVATLRAAGTYSSGPIANPGAISNVGLWVFASAVGGTTQTLDVVIQTSPDGSTWTSLTSSAITQMTAIGSAQSNAYVPAEYIQVLATVGGTGSPTVTFRVEVLVVPGG